MIKWFKDNLVAIVCSIIAALILLAISDFFIDMHVVARYILGCVAVVLLIIYFLPLVCVGLMCLIWCRVAKSETWIGKHLLKKYGNSHFLKMLFDPGYRAEAFYAVTAYVLSPDRKKLIMVNHETHKRWLPPGGRLLLNELPHQAIFDRVCAETGLSESSLHFSEYYHPIDNSHIAGDEDIEAHPRPWVIQTERNLQRGGIPFHYDFIYVLESGSFGPLIGTQNPQWVDMPDIDRMGESVKPFPNVVNLARKVLESYAAGNLNEESGAEK